MSVSQNQLKETTANLAIVFHLFKSPYFIFLSVVFVLAVSVAGWLYQQQVQQQQQSIVQNQAIADLTQDALDVQAVSQDLSQLVLSLEQAIKGLDQQLSGFLESRRIFLMNSVYQEAHYTQSIVMSSYEAMAQLNNALVSATAHAHQYRSQSDVHTAHYQHIQQLQNNADILGRAFFKLSWKFDELTAVITRTMQFVRYRGFDEGITHFSSTGMQKSTALNNGMFSVGSKFTDWQAQMGKTMPFIQAAMMSNAIKPTSSLFGSTYLVFVSMASLGLLAMAVVWFYGVLKPRVQLSEQIQALSEGHVSILSMPKGEWGSIAFHLESLAHENNVLQLNNATQSQELERLQLSLLSGSYRDDEALAINDLIASGELQGLSVFDVKPHQVN